jgi:hypothetical protein
VNVLGALLAMVIGTAIGAVVLGTLAQQALNDEATTLARRLGLPPPTSNGGEPLALLDVISPGASERVKKGAITAVVGGCAAAVVANTVARAVLTK